jgi:hypothetical protein
LEKGGGVIGDFADDTEEVKTGQWAEEQYQINTNGC